MRLAIAYTVFNGLELLEKSISQVSDFVDHVIICWQDVSNKGNRCDRVETYVRSLKNVTLVKFDPDLSVNTKENERRKHQLMMDTARELRCTHITLSACDHFYNPRQFVLAKLRHESANWDVSFTAMNTYYKHPQWQLTPIEDYYMPFIISLRADTKIKMMREYPLRVDPSVKVNTCNNWFLFPQDEIMLHHYSMIRDDIRSKFNNAAASIRWKPEDIAAFMNEWDNYDIETNPGIRYFQGRKIKMVNDYFGLS